MIANESLITESRKAKHEFIDKVVFGLALDEVEEKFLAFLVGMENMEAVLRFYSIIQKAEEYRQ